ncbi:MAG TPA: MoaD/ThiS family protein [Anaerolineae bacterium]|nr:MoaD/ThiS family protein [Anaerolineae bacterium]HQI83870.1 MoaD/ThiS family protein [Anaerolineae bacterium]
METIHVEVWLYGPLAKYGGSNDNIFALQHLDLPEGATLQDLLDHLAMPTEERGITFINGNLSAMPGLQPDLPHRLGDGDRVALFHTKSMWPFQYRHDVAMVSEFKETVSQRDDAGRRTRFDTIA